MNIKLCLCHLLRNPNSGSSAQTGETRAYHVWKMNLPRVMSERTSLYHRPTLRKSEKDDHLILRDVSREPDGAPQLSATYLHVLVYTSSMS